MVNIDYITEKNQHVSLKSVHDPSFKRFGKILSEFPVVAFQESMDEIQIPDEGNVYVPSEAKLEADTEVVNSISKNHFGAMPIQIGYCFGNNSKLGGLEFHKGSEINVAYTDFVVLVGHYNDLDENNNFKTEDIEGFIVPKGTIYEMYQTTLHLSPCKVDDEGFKCLVILPLGTNTQLSSNDHQDELLLQRNKWVICHPEHEKFVNQGVYKGIIGENIEINY